MMKIDDIKIGKRHREDVGNLQPLMNSIEEIGLLHPPVVNENGELIAGYRRVKACKKLGWDEIETRKVPIDSIVRGEFDENEVRKDFTAKEKVAIAKEVLPKEKEKAEERELAGASEKFTEGEKGEAKEKTAEKLGWSRPSLDKALEIDEASEENPEEYGDLEEVMESSVHSAYNELKRRKEILKREEELKDAPELKNLILGDCLERVDEIPDDSIDALITDPPYGGTEKLGQRGQLEKIRDDTYSYEGEDESIFSFLNQLLLKLEPKLKPDAHIYIFTDWKFWHNLFPVVNQHYQIQNMLVWDKRVGGLSGRFSYKYQNHHDLIMFASGEGRKIQGDNPAPSDILKFSRLSGGNRKHPTEKPIPLMKVLIKNSTVKGEIILDPFAGSGSTLVAAEELDRNWIGIELEERWYNTARERIAEVRENGN